MASFATPTDLGVLLDTTIAADDPRALLLLDLASAAIRATVGLTVDEVADETITIEGNGRNSIQLPEYPVTAIASISLDGTLLVEDDDYSWTSAGVLHRLPIGGLRTWTGTIEIEYTHGYATGDIPAVLRLVCLQAAARAWINPEGYGSETIGRYSVTYAGGRDGGRTVSVALTDDEVRLLRRTL